MSETDVKSEVLGALKSRLNHPFLFAFAISWVVFNWDFIVFLFVSADPAAARIQALKVSFVTINKSLWFPLIASASYVVIAPLLRTAIDMYNGFFILMSEKSDFRKRLVLAEHEHRVMKLEALASQYKMWQELRIKAREEVRAAMQEINDYVTSGRSASANLNNAKKAIDEMLAHVPQHMHKSLKEAQEVLGSLVARLNGVEKSSFRLAEIARSFDSFQEPALNEVAIVAKRN